MLDSMNEDFKDESSTSNINQQPNPNLFSPGQRVSNLNFLLDKKVGKSLSFDYLIQSLLSQQQIQHSQSMHNYLNQQSGMEKRDSQQMASEYEDEESRRKKVYICE